jgi:transmembrane 9 superfamily protein 2/4
VKSHNSLLGGIPDYCDISHIDNHLLLPVVHIPVFLCDTPVRDCTYCTEHIPFNLFWTKLVPGFRVRQGRPACPPALSTIGAVPHDRYHSIDYFCVFVRYLAVDFALGGVYSRLRRRWNFDRCYVRANGQYGCYSSPALARSTYQVGLPLMEVSLYINLCPSYSVGYSVTRYNDDEPIPLLVNKIFSDHTQLQYAYFDLPFVCPPSGKSHGGSPFGSGESVSLNLGEILRGDRIMTSDFELHMGRNVECQKLCTVEVGRKDVKWARQLIGEGYVAEWIADNLPGATSFVTVDRSRKYYATGFKIGDLDFSPSSGKPRYFINNHFTIVIRWRSASDGGKVVVGFEIYPKSIKASDYEKDGCPKKVHDEHEGLELYIAPNLSRLKEMYPDSSYLPKEDDEIDDGATLKIPYSYSVYFKEEPGIEWSNRWDLYFNNQDEGSMTHWLAVLNSLIISGVLGVAVYVIWGRTVQGDIKGRGDGAMEDGKIKLRSKSAEKKGEGLLDQGMDVERDADGSDDEALEDVSGWKLLHGDVFRVPEYSGLLAPLVGSGMQLFFMVSGLLILSCLGILNPSFRGGFVSVGMGLFVFAGLFSGYFSGRLYKTFGGVHWRKNTLIVS